VGQVAMSRQKLSPTTPEEDVGSMAFDPNVPKPENLPLGRLRLGPYDFHANNGGIGCNNDLSSEQAYWQQANILVCSCSYKTTQYETFSREKCVWQLTNHLPGEFKEKSSDDWDELWPHHHVLACQTCARNTEITVGTARVFTVALNQIQVSLE
jgi:hypothetical protein